MLLIRLGGWRAPRCRCRSAGRSWKPPNRWISEFIMCSRAWKRPVTGGLVWAQRNRVLRRLSEVAVELKTPRERGSHGRTFNRLSYALIRAGRHSSEAVFRRAVGQRRILQSAPQGLRLATQAAVPLPEARHGGRAR